MFMPEAVSSQVDLKPNLATASPSTSVKKETVISHKSSFAVNPLKSIITTSDDSPHN